MHPSHPKNKEFEFPLLPLMCGEQVVEVDPDQDHLTERYAREAIRFIIDNKDHPFFLMLSHKDVHVPWHAPEEAVVNSKDGYYGATVETIDHSTGMLMATLKKLNIDDRTLVVFSSDNGGTRRASNGPLKGWKGTTWEGGLRVPCVMRWPSVISEGRVCRQLATAMDLLPIFAALANNEAEVPAIIDGHNIWPLITDEPGALSPYEFFLYYSGYDLKAIRMGDWKYHLEEASLFNLDDDVGEQHDVADQYPEIVTRLSRQAAQCIEDYGNGNVKGRKQRAADEVENPKTILNEDHEVLIRSLDFNRE